MSSSFSMSSIDLIVATASPEKSFATLTSTGRGTFTLSIWRIFFAASTISGSANEAPTSFPLARRNVLAIPPPTMT